MALESLFGVSTSNKPVLLGTRLGDFCLETIITYREKKAQLHKIRGLERLVAEEEQRIEIQAREKLRGMVSLATDDCVEKVLRQMTARGVFGRSNYVQKSKIRAFNEKLSKLSARAETALASFQAEMVDELFEKLETPVRIQKPLAINVAECNVVTILTAFIDMRPRAEAHIEEALTDKLVTKKSEKNNR